MRKLGIVLILLLSVMLFEINHAYAANGNDGLKYYYKGSGAGYKYAGSDDVYYNSNNEWITVTAHQHFNASTAVGRAKIRGYSRIGSVKKDIGSTYKVKVDSIYVGVKDVDSRSSLWINDKAPYIQATSLIPQWLYQLVGISPIGTVIDIITNGISSKISHQQPGGISNQLVDAYNVFGLDYSVTDAPTSVVHSNVENWASGRAVIGQSSGFTGLFLYNIGYGTYKNYNIQGYAKALYTAKNNLLTFPLQSNTAGINHVVNTQ